MGGGGGGGGGGGLGKGKTENYDCLSGDSLIKTSLSRPYHQTPQKNSLEAFNKTVGLHSSARQSVREWCTSITVAISLLIQKFHPLSFCEEDPTECCQTALFGAGSGTQTPPQTKQSGYETILIPQ